MRPLTTAELKRILQPGLRLRLVRFGECDKPRTVVCVRSKDFVVRTECGELSYCQFPPKHGVVGTDRGFKILDEGEVAAEYEYVDGHPVLAKAEGRA